MKKLLKLSPDELYVRSKQMLYTSYERWTHTRYARPMTDDELLRQVRIPDSPRSTDMLLAHFRTRTTPSFFFEHQPADALRSCMHDLFPDLLASTLKAANGPMHHAFSFLGIDVQYDDCISWNADPVSGREWPRVFYADVDIFSGDHGYGDIKHVWELNRHQYFVDLGKAYWLTGESKYADKFMHLFTSWVDANPYNTGVNWTSTLEHAFRVLSWIWTYYFCRDGLTPEFHLLFLKTLYRHAHYISKHLSFYHSPYNHLVGEATALFFVGALFPEFKPARKWAGLGWQILDTNIDRQLYPDGFTVEQASFYHHATLGFYLLAGLLRKLNGWPVRQALWERLERAIAFSIYLTQPNGSVPRLGDVDDARPIRLSHRPLWDFREFHTIGAILFGRPDFKYAAGTFTEEALWLFGIQGHEIFSTLRAKEPPETSKSFPESGYYFMRTGWERDAHWLCFDCGEQAAGLSPGPTPSAVHGHADALSVLLTANGEPMLVDGGLYTYNGDKMWRDYFRETRAHNTVVVEGENQALHLGGIAWARAARTTCEEWVTTPTFDYVCGMHDGYSRLLSPVVHRRAIFFRKPHYWLIFDELQGEGEHSIESYLHLAPSHIVRQADGLTVHFACDTTLSLSTVGVLWDLDVMTESKPAHPDSGWIGSSYGCRIAAPIIRWHASLDLPVRWCTLLALDPELWRLTCHDGDYIVYGQNCEDRYAWQAPAAQTREASQTVETTVRSLHFELNYEAQRCSVDTCKE